MEYVGLYIAMHTSPTARNIFLVCSRTIHLHYIKKKILVAKAVEQQLDSASQWCHDTESLINPDKAQTLWCTLDNNANRCQQSHLMELLLNEQVI